MKKEEINHQAPNRLESYHIQSQNKRGKCYKKKGCGFFPNKVYVTYCKPYKEKEQGKNQWKRSLQKGIVLNSLESVCGMLVNPSEINQIV